MNVQGEITFNGSGTYSFNGTILDSSASSFPTPQALQLQPARMSFPPAARATSAPSIPIFPTIRSSGWCPTAFSSAAAPRIATVITICSSPRPSAHSPPTLRSTAPTSRHTSTLPSRGDALFTMNANGSGTIGAVNVTGYTATNTTSSTETLTGVTYSFRQRRRTAQLRRHLQRTWSYGTEVLYITPDGNFIFGGSANGFDIFAGVRAATSNPSNYDGLYYQAGLDLDDRLPARLHPIGQLLRIAELGRTSAFRDKYYRAPAPELVAGIWRVQRFHLLRLLHAERRRHLRLQLWSGLCEQRATEPFASAMALGPYLSLNVALQAPPFNGSGVYLSPHGSGERGQLRAFYGLHISGRIPHPVRHGPGSYHQRRRAAVLQQCSMACRC